MSRIDMAERREGRVVLERPEGAEPAAGAGEAEALLLSRPDFDVHVVELPPAAAKEPAGYLRYRLPSLYPGRPEACEFDYRLFRLGAGRFAALFIAGSEVLQGYREAARGRPLLLPFSLFEPLLPGGRGRGRGAGGGEAVLLTFWQRGWVDALLLPPAGGTPANGRRPSWSAGEDRPPPTSGSCWRAPAGRPPRCAGCSSPRRASWRAWRR